MEVSSPLLVCCVCTALPASFQASSNFLSTRPRPVPSLLFVALVPSSTKQCNVVLIDLIVHKFWQMKGLADTHSYVYDPASRRCLCKSESNGQCLESSLGLWRNLRHLQWLCVCDTLEQCISIRDLLLPHEGESIYAVQLRIDPMINSRHHCPCRGCASSTCVCLYCPSLKIFILFYRMLMVQNRKIDHYASYALTSWSFH